MLKIRRLRKKLRNKRRGAQGNRKKYRVSFSSALSIILVAATAVMFVYTSALFLFEVTKPRRIFFDIEIPSGMETLGITRKRIAQIEQEVDKNIDSLYPKLMQIVGSEADAIPEKQRRIWKRELHKASMYKDVNSTTQIFLNGLSIQLDITKLVQEFRKLMGKNDLKIMASFVLTDKKELDVKIYSNGEAVRQFLFPAECSSWREISSLFHKIELHITEQYNPMAAVLSDYRLSDGTNNYNNRESYWREEEYSFQEKVQLLEKFESGIGKEWRYIVLGHIYETKGYSSGNVLYFHDAENYYRKGLESIPECRNILEARIDKMKTLLAQKDLKVLKPLDLIEKVKEPYGRKLAAASQCLLIVSNIREANQALVFALQRNGDNEWESAFPPMKAHVGARGFSPLGKKREGDKTSPSGLFALTKAFGYDTLLVPIRVDYTRLTFEHVWITDTLDEMYNHFVVDKEKKYRDKGEVLLRQDNLNKYGIVIDYNVHPHVIRGKGSAIFIRCQHPVRPCTAGCVALKETDVHKLILWLDRDKHPVTVMGCLGDKSLFEM